MYFWITDSYLKADQRDPDEEGKEMSPVSNIGETVTPYSKMGDAGDELNGMQKSMSKGDVASYGSTPDQSSFV